MLDKTAHFEKGRERKENEKKGSLQNMSRTNVRNRSIKD